MTIRTSGYYKESRNLGELVYNSDFEFGIKGWKYEGWQYVILPDFAVQEDVNSIYPEEAIEIFPEDLLMLCVTVRETTYSHTFRMRLKYYDKHDKVITYEEVSKKPLADTTTTYNLLFAPSTLFFNEYTSSHRSIRAVRPWIYALKNDGWTTGDTLTIFGISLRRINPDWLKSLPVELWSCLYISGLEKGTYYGDEYYTGVFKEGDYVLYIGKIEDSGSGGLTFKCSIQSYDIITNKWYDAVVFDDVEIPSSGNVQSVVDTKVATSGLGIRQRVKWSLTGDGTPGFTTFKVGVTYKQ